MTRRRWKFDRYDDRGRGIASSHGWLHYIGLGPMLFVVGVHRGWRYRRGGLVGRGRPSARIELTLYLGGHMLDVHPGLPVPKAWL